MLTVSVTKLVKIDFLRDFTVFSFHLNAVSFMNVIIFLLKTPASDVLRG